MTSDLTLKQRLALLAFDKLLLGAIVAAGLAGANYVVSDRLARGTAIYNSRVERIRELWGTTYQYGRELHAAFSEQRDTPTVRAIVLKFDQELASAGVFIGKQKVDEYRTRLVIPLLSLSEKKKKAEHEAGFDAFLKQWDAVLDELAKTLE